MGDIRAFIAVELPSEVKVELADLINKLKIKHTKSVKWVNPDGIHLTIKFLGNIAEEKVPGINCNLAEVASHSIPFDLYLDKIGAFPNIQSPRVAWVGITGGIPDLINIHRKIENCLLPLGFANDNKSYSAHLTIGRVRETADKPEKDMLGKALSELKVMRNLSFHVDGFSLIKSTLTPKGAIYERLSQFTLDKH